MLTLRILRDTDSLQELTGLLHRAYAELSAAGLNFTAVDQSPEVTAQRIAGGTCFLARWDETLVGTILAKPTEPGSACRYFRQPGVATLRQFAVDPGHRGKGVGLRLIEACEQWARDAGFEEIALDTARPAQHLISLYTRLGYQIVETVQWEGKTYESVVMRKQLGHGWRSGH